MSINKVILKGRLGSDPLENNGVVKFTLATSESYKDKEGNKVESTEWHNITAFGKLGEIFLKHLSKGSEVLIIGKIKYHKKEDKYYTSIIANEFDFVGSSKNDKQQKIDEVIEENTQEDGSDDLPF